MSALHGLLRRSVGSAGPLLMGVVNVTPDSFSDGSLYFEATAACARIDELIAQGAHLIDIGGESTRPGARAVPADEQLRRVLPALRHAVQCGVLVSIDTASPHVARVALEAGACIVNDVSCLRDGDVLARIAAASDAAMILMHSREPMQQMQGFSVYPQDAYDDVVADVTSEWLQAAERAQRAGLPREELLLDPGLGFNKNARHSAELVARLHELVSLGWPVVVGPSRKSFLASDVRTEPSRRLGGTVAACLACAARGAAVLRVHDVIEVRQALAVSQAVRLLEPPLVRPEVAHA